MVLAAAIGRDSGDAAQAIREISTGGARLASSDASVTELSRTVRYSGVEARIATRGTGRAFGIALELAYAAEHYLPRPYDWPSIQDRKDHWLLDLAFEAGADHIVTRDGHLDPARSLGFSVITDSQLLALLP